MSSSKLTFSNPFAEVEVQPVVVAGEAVPTRVAVRVQADEGGYQVQGIVGRDYQLLPNRKVRDVAEDIMSRASGEFGGFNLIKTLWDGKRYVDYFASRNPIFSANGDRSRLELCLGLMIWNSYDGTRKVGFEVYALNPFCTNQYHSRNRFGFFAWRHQPGEAGQIDADEALEGIGRGVANIVQIGPAIQQLKDKPLMLDDFLTSEECNHFGFYQSLTGVASHKLGGMSAINTGTSITEYFLNPKVDVAHHATAESVLASKV